MRAVEPLLNRRSFLSVFKGYDPYDFRPVSVKVLRRGIAMVKPRTHFEQVPLEVVKKLVAAGTKLAQTAEQVRAAKEEKLEGDPLGALAVRE